MADYVLFQMKPNPIRAARWTGHGSHPAVEEYSDELDVDVPEDMEVGAANSILGTLPVFPGDWVLEIPHVGCVPIPENIIRHTVVPIDDAARAAIGY